MKAKEIVIIRVKCIKFNFLHLISFVVVNTWEDNILDIYSFVIESN